MFLQNIALGKTCNTPACTQGRYKDCIRILLEVHNLILTFDQNWRHKIQVTKTSKHKQVYFPYAVIVSPDFEFGLNGAALNQINIS